MEAVVDYRNRASAEVDPWPDGPGEPSGCRSTGWTFGVKVPHDAAGSTSPRTTGGVGPLDVTGDADHPRRPGRRRRLLPAVRPAPSLLPGVQQHHKSTYDDAGRVPSSLAWQLNGWPGCR